MEEEKVPQTTLRDTIAEQFDALETPETPAPAPEKVDVPVVEETKPGRTAGRQRDEQGRLLPGKVEKEEIPPQVAEVAKPGAVAPVLTPAVEPRPSSWKKEMWEHWDKLPSDVAKYINQRESEFAKGVSTYKQEYENARPVMEALAPHMPLLQQHGIDPGQQVARYMQVHKVLALGSPQEKLGLFAQMAKDYQVPLEQMFLRGNDGQVYLNNQLSYTPAQQAPDVEKIIETKLIEKEAQQAARLFTEAKDSTGNPVHPHFETVRETMSQLLAAGIAQDLQSAYDAALRLPQHQPLFDQLQQQKTALDEAEKQKKLVEQAGLARRNTVSVKSATPAGKTVSQAKGIRGALEEAFETHIPGRV
jgi:hypothetical protein